MKEGINILLVSNQVFDLWSIIFLAWEEGRILDGIDSLCRSPSLGLSTKAKGLTRV